MDSQQAVGHFDSRIFNSASSIATRDVVNEPRLSQRIVNGAYAVTFQRGCGSDAFQLTKLMESESAVGWSETPVGVEPTSIGLQPIALPSGSSVLSFARALSSTFAPRAARPGIEPGPTASEAVMRSNTLTSQNCPPAEPGVAPGTGVVRDIIESEEPTTGFAPA